MASNLSISFSTYLVHNSGEKMVDLVSYLPAMVDNS